MARHAKQLPLQQQVFPGAHTPVAAAGLAYISNAFAQAAGRFQLVTTLLKLLPLVAVGAILAFIALPGGPGFAREAHTPFAWSQLTPALTLAFFALVGFESAALAAERVVNPARNVVRATLAGLALTALLYLIVSTGIAFMIGRP